ncbi:2-amino-4-hydroxy-6-hydroxymethyldihydropteridine diphosphokinase [Falsirhodobacter sp. alg1]|uniref:2-amino-4-hydroxy-6- hydroxymethyldihydropteridine diphosphokinase n=1 Tax=Falsirhodobacter sp. alg1 TaxID=1472418 RepID=UPI0005F032C2|nr:2-amino-4-hydroxy-6-hydroxymethyldihydropteridine diphosphokinase [Falsirhodobacter sp. alg1]
MERMFVALGSNQPLGDAGPDAVLQAGIGAMTAEGITLIAVSPFYQTPAFPAGSGPDYINAVAEIGWPGAPQDLLAALHRIERGAARIRARRWGPRTLDLDLLAVGDQVVPSVPEWRRWHGLAPDLQMSVAPECLVLPHPRLQDRSFVLVPWADVAPDWCHPVLKLTVAQMRDALPAGDVAGVALAKPVRSA